MQKLTAKKLDAIMENTILPHRKNCPKVKENCCVEYTSLKNSNKCRKQLIADFAKALNNYFKP